MTASTPRKRLAAFAGAIMMAALSSVCCSEKVRPSAQVESVSVSPSSAILDIGQTISLSASVMPADASDAVLTWKSDNPSVATVLDGLVTASAPGSARISAASSNGKSGFCDITVLSPVVHVSSVTLNPSETTMTEGQTLQLDVTVLPSDATDKSLSWSSSDESVLTVSDGLVRAVSPGEAVVTVTSRDSHKSATCRITVLRKTVHVTSISLDRESLALMVGQSTTLKAAVLPENADNRAVTWSSSNPSVATVESGKVTAGSKGSCTITVTSSDGGLTASCRVTVSDTAGEIPPINWED